MEHKNKRKTKRTPKSESRSIFTNRKMMLLAVSALTMGGITLAQDAKLNPGKMTTEWGEQVTPENAWRAYPRPQLKRHYDEINLSVFKDFLVEGKNTLVMEIDKVRAISDVDLGLYVR